MRRSIGPDRIARMRIAWFRLRCAAMRLVAFCIAFPVGLVIVPFLIIQKKADFTAFTSMFSPREWNDMFGNGPEISSSYFWVLGSDYSQNDPLPELPPNCWYHATNRVVACLAFEDAAWVRLRFNGTIQERKPRFWK
jgi:hypothetical protein